MCEIESELAALHRAFDAPPTVADLLVGLVENFLGQIAHRNLIPGNRQDLRDAAAHHTTAYDTDVSDLLELHISPNQSNDKGQPL